MKTMNLGEFSRKHKVSIIIFTLALIVRLALFFVNLDANKGDFIETIRAADGYYEISQNLIAGNGYSDDFSPAHKPNYLRPPVWIFMIAFIAWVSGSYVPVFVFVLLLGSLIPILGMYLAERIVSMKLAVLTGFFLAVEPNSVFNSIWLASETCFTFLFLIFSIFIFRYIAEQTTRNAVWAGVFLGLAILVKPTVQFLPFLVPVLSLYFFRKSVSRIHWKHALFFVAVCLLTLAPWFYRNYREFGSVSLSSQAAFNLYTVLVPTVLSIDNGTSFETERASGWFRDSLVDVDITPANGSYFTKKAVFIISEHKLAMIKSAGMSVFTFFTHDGMLSVLGYAGVTIPNLLDKPALTLLLTEPLKLFGYILRYVATPGLFIFLGRIMWVFITALFFFGAWRYCRKEKISPYALYSLFVVVYFALTTMANGLGMNARFRLPVLGFIAAFALYGFFVLWEFLKKKFLPRHA